MQIKELAKHLFLSQSSMRSKALDLKDCDSEKQPVMHEYLLTRYNQEKDYYDSLCLEATNIGVLPEELIKLYCLNFFDDRNL